MTPPTRVPETSTIWFVSDVHLYFGGEEYLGQFCDFIQQASARADELWIVGDLFEFWIGPRQGSLPFYARLFDHLRQLTDGGTALKVVHGNRDFLMGRAMQAAGAEMLPDEVVIETGESLLHVSHGDQFCIHDRSYQMARVVMRSWPVRALASLLPVSIGLMLARRYRGISERKKLRSKEQGAGSRFHTIEDGIKQLLQTSPVDTVLCGHIHDYAERTVTMGERNVRVVTTGAWEEGPNFAIWERGALSLHRFSAAAKPASPLV